ncbi:MAG: hypothetical protein AB7T14_10175 [Candidatus Methylacidiphilaceae bacterium]
MRHPRLPPLLPSDAILIVLLLAWPIGALLAREIPDVLGQRSPLEELAPGKGPRNHSEPKNALDRAPQAKPKSLPPEVETLRGLLPGAMRKSFFLPERTGYWIARWIDPDGEESPPIPLWVDREGDGHFLLRAAVIQGEDRPLLFRAPRIWACQVLSLFRESGGALRPIASDVWIELPEKKGGAERHSTGRGRWQSPTPLTAARIVFSPFLPALRESADPAIRALAAYRWPDVALVRMPGTLPPPEEPEESRPERAAAE